VRFAESDLPAVGDHDILVKVVAASVNPIDYKLVHGDLRRVHRLDFPAPFGFDCCGRVEALGSKVVGHEAGDLVYARAPRTRMGTFAEFVAITLGGSTTSASFSVLKPGGTVVSVAGPPDRAFARQVGATPALSFVLWCISLPMELRARRIGGHYFRFLTESSGAQLEHVGRLLDAGKIRTVVEKIYPFDQAIEALQFAATGRAKGKLVIQIAT
jgi:NADPH:quinone reductase-like Zn-dependent oxidoreductase